MPAVVMFVVHHIPNVGDTKLHGIFLNPDRAWDAMLKLITIGDYAEMTGTSRASIDAAGFGTIFTYDPVKKSAGMLQCEPMEINVIHAARGVISQF